MLRSQAKSKTKSSQTTSHRSKSTTKPKKQITKKSQHTAKRHQSISVLQAITGKTNTKSVPLDVVHPDTQFDEMKSLDKTPGPPQISKLRNGIRVITQECNHPVSHIAISVETGSRFENHDANEAGITNFLERAILRSTTNRVTGVLIRDLAKLGADISTTSSRENLMITASTPTRINPVMGALADIIKNASYDFVDFRDDLQFYMQDNESRQSQEFDITVHEALHQAAFGNKGLGQTLYMNKEGLTHLQPKHLKQWQHKFFVANRMTIAAVGVDHDSFVKLADEMFGSLPEETVEIPHVPTKYIGGNLRLQNAGYSGPTHVTFAWDAPSLLDDDVVAANVLQSLIGGGASFSSGGPGKGMYTRLYTNILGTKAGVHNASSFITSYSDAGIMGVYGQVEADYLMDYTNAVLSELMDLPNTIQDAEVSRAKNMLKSNLYSHISPSGNKAEELARNIQLFDEYRFPKFMDQIDNITTQDVKNVAIKIFHARKPLTITTLGDASQLPRDINLFYDEDGQEGGQIDDDNDDDDVDFVQDELDATPTLVAQEKQ